MLWKFNADGEHEPVDDPIEWAHWMQQSESARRVGWTAITENVVVSTLFLGTALNLMPMPGWPPLLYETSIFLLRDGRMPIALVDHYWRYATRNEAQRGHDQIVEQLHAGRGVDEIELDWGE